MKRQILIVSVLYFLLLVFSKGVFAGAEDDSFRAAVEEIFATYSAVNVKKRCRWLDRTLGRRGNKDVPEYTLEWDRKASFYKYPEHLEQQHADLRKEGIS